jgi:hypothetical protein
MGWCPATQWSTYIIYVYTSNSECFPNFHLGKFRPSSPCEVEKKYPWRQNMGKFLEHSFLAMVQASTVRQPKEATGLVGVSRSEPSTDSSMEGCHLWLLDYHGLSWNIQRVTTLLVFDYCVWFSSCHLWLPEGNYFDISTNPLWFRPGKTTCFTGQWFWSLAQNVWRCGEIRLQSVHRCYTWSFVKTCVE